MRYSSPGEFLFISQPFSPGMKTRIFFRITLHLLICLSLEIAALGTEPDTSNLIRNTKMDGYLGIWYFNQKLDNEYVYKYSGGLGTYCARHQPFAIYSPEADKTFFFSGGCYREKIPCPSGRLKRLGPLSIWHIKFPYQYD